MGFRGICTFSACVIGLYICAAPMCRANDGYIFPILVSVQTTPDPIRPGPVGLRLVTKSLLPTMPCKEIGLNLLTVDHVVYNGSRHLVAPSDDSGVAVFDLAVEFPANDTAGFVMQVECDGRFIQPSFLYWVVRDDSVRFYRGDPRTSPEVLYPPSEPRVITREERQLEKMRRLEELPLTEYETQTIQVGDKVYQRRYGEFKFHEIQPVDDPVAHMRRVADSLRGIRADMTVECIVDLRDSIDLKYVRSVADSLKPTDRPGFYRVFLKAQKFMEIRDRGIPVEIISPRPDTAPNEGDDDRQPAPDSRRDAIQDNAKPGGTLEFRKVIFTTGIIRTLFYIARGSGRTAGR